MITLWSSTAKRPERPSTMQGARYAGNSDSTLSPIHKCNIVLVMPSHVLPMLNRNFAGCDHPLNRAILFAPIPTVYIQLAHFRSFIGVRPISAVHETSSNVFGGAIEENEGCRS